MWLRQMVNRAFFTLISLSLVSASSRLAYDQLGGFQPALLRYAKSTACLLFMRGVADASTLEGTA